MLIKRMFQQQLKRHNAQFATKWRYLAGRRRPRIHRRPVVKP